MDGGQDRGDIVGGRPSVLEDIETELAVGIDVWVKHSAKEFDGGRFVGVGFVEGEDELEGAVFEWCFCCTRAFKIRVRQFMKRSTDIPGPKITAFHSMMLSGHGLPEMPPGGSLARRLKSRMRRRLQFVDYENNQIIAATIAQSFTHHIL